MTARIHSSHITADDQVHGKVDGVDPIYPSIYYCIEFFALCCVAGACGEGFHAFMSLGGGVQCAVCSPVQSCPVRSCVLLLVRRTKRSSQQYCTQLLDLAQFSFYVLTFLQRTR